MSDEHYPEFTSAQTERLDEIDNAVYQTILAFLNKSEDEFPGICTISEKLRNVLRKRF